MPTEWMLPFRHESGAVRELFARARESHCGWHLNNDDSRRERMPMLGELENCDRRPRIAEVDAFSHVHVFERVCERMCGVAKDYSPWLLAAVDECSGSWLPDSSLTAAYSMSIAKVDVSVCM